jgi:large subunit ribosomal protein L22
LVMDLVRGRTVNQALDTLDNDRHRASRSIAKVLRSAVANALQNPEVRANRLVVSEAFCNEGPLLQNRMRFRPSAMGRALPFRRRTCHIHIKINDPEVLASDDSVVDPAPAPESEATLAGSTGEAEEQQ